MGKGVGKALEHALKDKEAPDKTIQSKGVNLFSNRYRRAIFSVLTLSPCMNIAEISRRTKIKANTVGWHIQRLTKSGYVVRRRVGGRSIYFPEGLVPSNDIVLFHTLNQFYVRALFELIFNNPGSSQRELSDNSGMSYGSVSNTMKSLQSMGLISSVSDGSHIRFYPTRLLADKSDDYYKRSKGFSEFLLNKIQEDVGSEPRIIKKSVERIILELGPRKGKYTLEIGINPYMTFL